MAFGVGARIRAEKRVFKEEEARELARSRMAEIERRGELALRAVEKPERASSRLSTARPISEVPYLPESREKKGALADIMRASPKELENIYERMPEGERPVHIIRGERQSWFSPGTNQEYGNMRTAMSGFKQRPASARSEERQTTTKETGLMSRASMREAGLMDRARMEGKAGGMTLYQAGTLGQKKKEFKFEQSQAELDFINKGLKTAFDPVRAMGKVPTKDQTISQTGILRNQWIKAYYSPDEAAELIAKNPVELRKNKKTGKLRWYNEYGEPVNAENPKRKLSSTNMGTLPNEESFEDYTPPSFESSVFGKIRPSAEQYPTKLSNMRKTPQQGLSEIGSGMRRLGSEIKTVGSQYGRMGRRAWKGYDTMIGRFLESQKKSREGLSNRY